MARWKLGEGDDYSSLVGFTWPEGENPRAVMITAVVNQERINEIKMKEYAMLLDMGVNNMEISFNGWFRNESDFRNLRKQVLKSRILIKDGEEYVDMFYEQMLYCGSEDWFYYVKRGTFRENRESRRPLFWAYDVKFVLTDPFRYDDNEKVDSESGSSGSVSINVGGDVFNLPTFEFEGSGNTLNISGAGGSIVVSGLGLSGGKVVINQRLNTAFVYDSSGNLVKNDKSYYGRIAVKPGSSYSFNWSTDGSGTFRVRLRDRYL